MPTATKLPFEVILEESMQGGEKPYVGLVTSEAAWYALKVKAALPEGTDFEKQALLVVVSGMRPDLSHTAKIHDVLDLEPVLGAKVAVVLYEEGTDGPPAEAIAHPICVARVQRSKHHLLFARL